MTNKQLLTDSLALALMAVAFILFLFIQGYDMKVNDIVKIKPECCDIGEEGYTYKVIKLYDDNDSVILKDTDTDNALELHLPLWMIEGEPQ